MQLINRKNKERLKNGSIPLFLCIFGLLAFVFQPDLKSGIPTFSSLKHASGVVSSVYRSQGKSPYVEFNLRGIMHPFLYGSRSKEVWIVGNTLEKAMIEKKPIDILYDIDNFTNFFIIEKKSYDVWQLQIDGESIKTFNDISTAYEEDNRLGQIMFQLIGGLFLLFGIVSGLAFLKKEFGKSPF